MRELIIDKCDENQTLIKYLNRFLKNAPNGLLYKQLRNKNIVLNGKKADGKEKIKAGDSIKIFMSEDTISKFSETAEIDTMEFVLAFKKFGTPKVIYENEHILLINKPVGILSQKSEVKDFSVNEWLIGYMLSKNETDSSKLNQFKPSICNRLDRNTGGIISFGKTLFGVNLLNEFFKDRTLHKFYKTIVCGEVLSKTSLKGYLFKDEKTNKVLVSSEKKEDFDYIETEYTPIRYDKKNNITELEVLLVTGKPHQIRAHLSSIGHPIIGDEKYGNHKENQKFKEAFSLKNQFLYAYKLVFPENDYLPLSNKTFEINIKKELDKYF